MFDIDAIKWPEHKCGMHITHNQHKDYYETVEQALDKPPNGHSTYDRDDFPDEDEITKAIESDCVWTIQWYPNSPVGFCRVSAATLSRALQEACK